jgi:hypothetical protein
MNKIRVSLSLALGGLLLASCATIGPGTTIPPINIPSFSLPSFAIPSFQLPPGFTLPPVTLPSGLSTGGECPFISAAEVTTIMGSAPISSNTNDGTCQFTFQNFSGVNVSIESGSDLTTSRFLFGDSAKDQTVAGLPALSGTVIIAGQPAVHVQRGADQLQVLGILTGTDDAAFAKLHQVAAIAVSHGP